VNLNDLKRAGIDTLNGINERLLLIDSNSRVIQPQDTTNIPSDVYTNNQSILTQS
jgi:hypothetical protein